MNCGAMGTSVDGHKSDGTAGHSLQRQRYLSDTYRPLFCCVIRAHRISDFRIERGRPSSTDRWTLQDSSQCLDSFQSPESHCWTAGVAFFLLMFLEAA